jgi:hypothetical protein
MDRAKCFSNFENFACNLVKSCFDLALPISPNPNPSQRSATPLGAVQLSRAAGQETVAQTACAVLAPNRKRPVRAGMPAVPEVSAPRRFVQIVSTEQGYPRCRGRVVVRMGDVRAFLRGRGLGGVLFSTA